MSGLARLGAGDRSRLRIGLAVPMFTLAVGLSAFLLFSIQPMFTKIVLPILGGSPAVWSVAMVFFQAMLLAGYGYAHVLTTRLSPRRAALLHVAVMLVVMVVALPIGLSTALGKPPADGTAFWLLAVFTLSVGLPFFVVSAHGPLLQAWFARTGHAASGDPYFLYAASNIGSLVALLSFPFLVEPLLPTRLQTVLWSFGFGFLIAAIAFCAAFLPAGGSQSAGRAGLAAEERASAPTWPQRLTWCVLAFIPSGLLVAATAHISTDVAAAPLLWVIPLSLFLLTFIITFQPRPWLAHRLMVAMLPGSVVAAFAFGGMLVDVGTIAALVVTLAAFFVCAMVFHGELVRLRPAASHLTVFYVWMSVGGVLGGIFAGLLAPHMFSNVVEYSLLLAAALVIRVTGCPQPSVRTVIVAAAVTLCGAALLVVLTSAHGPTLQQMGSRALTALAGLAVVLVLTRAKTMAMALMMVAPILISYQIKPYLSSDMQSFRSFFGVSKIVTSEDGRLRYLAHGVTYHGAQRFDQMGQGVRPDPLTYYYHGGPFDQAIEATRVAKGGRLGKVAVVGLGTGSQACLSRPGETWSFYEIDPHVIRIARDPSLFTFMSACAPSARIVAGDARLMLQDTAPATYDLIIVDAFSSDSIPLHLVTREAIELYSSRLTPGGAIVFHISNNNLTIGPFVAATAASRSLGTWQNNAQPVSAEQARDGKTRSDIALVTDNGAVFAALGQSPGRDYWKNITPAPGAGVQPWTDDFSNILKAAWFKFNEQRVAR